MGAVWLRATAQLRGRVRASLLLALLVGLCGGVVLAAELRAVAALPQVRTASRASVLIMSGPNPVDPTRPNRQLGYVGPDRPEEAAIDEEVAWRYGLRVVGVLRFPDDLSIGQGREGGRRRRVRPAVPRRQP